MKITKLLDRPIAYHRCFVTLTGSVKAAILLSQAVYWQERAKQEDGYWYKTIEEWQEETGLTDHEQRTARRDCAKYLLSDLRGVPAQLFYKVDEEALEADLLPQTVRTSSAESAEQVGHKPQNIKRNAETTTENTSEDISEQANRKIDAILDMANFPGAKREARVDAILSYIGGRFQINTETNAWRKFARYADDMHEKNRWEVKTFFDWLIAQTGFDLSYWPPAKMSEHYPRAFVKATPIRKEGESSGYFA